MRRPADASASASASASARDAEASVSGFSVSSALGVGAKYVEKAILQNLYQDKMLLYRNYRVADVGLARTDAETNAEKKDAAEASVAAAKHALVHLWDFICDETRGREVSCVAWNRLAPDVLAVGYGSRSRSPRAENKDASNAGAGLVAFWSLKNPEHPEWHFATPFGVTALDFSPTEFNLLAVGLHDGTVSVYDARVPTTAPFLKSGGGVPGKHSDPVWQVRWVPAGGDRDASALVSISTDGRVTQWKLTKGLEHVDLMRLTRVARRPGPGPKHGPKQRLRRRSRPSRAAARGRVSTFRAPTRRRTSPARRRAFCTSARARTASSTCARTTGTAVRCTAPRGHPSRAMSSRRRRRIGR